VKRRLIAAGAGLLIILVGTGVYVLFPHGRILFGNVQGSADVAFAASQTPLAESRAAAAARLGSPVWGLVPERTRFIPGIGLAPPFRVQWTLHAHALIELPPVVGYGRLYFGTHAGVFTAASGKTGHVVWQRNLGECIASSPALSGGVVYIGTMGKAPCDRYRGHRGRNGELIALDALDGQLLWRLHTGLIESSPLLIGHWLFFSSYLDNKSGYVYGIDTRSREVVWSAFVPAKLTSSPSLEGRTLYFASYGGYVYALDSRTGTEHWRSPTLVDLFQSRGFYAAPAIAWGRVFIGGLDGRMYAFGQRTGRLLWTHGVSGSVYSSAALWHRSVFAGSFHGGLYALDAATGKVEWQFDPPGSHVLGSPTVIAGLVYFATREGTTYALNAATGKVAWSFPDGQYTPMVADRHRLYLVGTGRIYGLLPCGRSAGHAGARAPEVSCSKARWRRGRQ
jgi:outer membrane protein assembly factor BamB